MKNFKKLPFIIAGLIIFLLSACRFGYNEPPKNVTDNEGDTGLSIAKQSLQFIHQHYPDSLRGLFNSRVNKITKPEQLDRLIREGQQVLNEYYFPNDTSILVSQTTNYSTTTGKSIIRTFTFPFQNKTYMDSLKYFHITVVNNKILKLILSDYPPGLNIIEPKNTEPHLDTLNLQVYNLKWFRIWYDDGSKINKKYFFNTGFYAISGDKDKLIKIGMDSQFQEIFNLINSAKFDSLDFKYLDDIEVGDPEYIGLRLAFDNEEYKNLGEFKISYFIDEEDGKKEIMSDYIVIKHTEKTRYLLLKHKNPELVEKLTEIAHHDYGKYYEIDP